MRQEARLSTVNRANVTIPFTAEFYFKTDRIIITNNYRVVINRDLTSNEKALTHDFSPTDPYLYIVWDDKEDKEKSTAVSYLMKHIHVDCETEKNINLKKAIFKFENIGKTKSNNVIINKKALMVANICNEFTFAKLRDIAFWYSDKLGKTSVIKMSAEDIYLALLDRKTGILINSPDEFLNRYKSPDIQYNVIINKALMLNVITKEKGFYFVGQEQIGASFEDLISYCKLNEKMFNDFIKPQVQKTDKLPVDIDYRDSVSSFMEEKPAKELDTNDLKTPKEKKIEGYHKANDDEDLIRLQAKNLGVKSWQTKKIENLKEEIEVLKPIVA